MGNNKGNTSPPEPDKPKQAVDKGKGVMMDEGQCATPTPGRRAYVSPKLYKAMLEDTYVMELSNSYEDLTQNTFYRDHVKSVAVEPNRPVTTPTMASGWDQLRLIESAKPTPAKVVYS